MTFGTLALISVVAVAGPVLATPARLRLPVMLGELAAGVLLGPTVLDRLHAGEPTFAFLAQVGFVLVMFVAGSHVPVRDERVRSALAAGSLRGAAVAVVAAGLGLAVAHGFGTGHAALYAVLMASSSAAVVLPVVDSLQLAGPPVLELLAQVALADTACIVAVPLVIDPSHAGRAALGALAVIGAAVAFFLVLWYFERRGVRRRVHKLSERRKFALELRVSLCVVFLLAALAVRTHVSVMLAGFSFGLAIAQLGEPRRLARQLFAVTEGFFGPLFFVWLGSSLDLHELGNHASFVLLGLALGGGASVAHGVMAATRQPLPLATLAAAQLGVPIAAAALGEQLHALRPGEPAALVLGALVTVAVTAVSGGAAVRAGLVAPSSDGDPAVEEAPPG